MAAPCPACGCTFASPVHTLVVLLMDDDLDRAIDAGLLDAMPCAACTPACGAVLVDARDARREALAARDRFRAREHRLAERQARRDAARRPRATGTTAALPTAAAAALARALAKAKSLR